MDMLGIDQEIARQILEDELAAHRAYRYRLTIKLRIYNRVEADLPQREAMAKELEKVEEVIMAYEEELASLI